MSGPACSRDRVPRGAYPARPFPTWSLGPSGLCGNFNGLEGDDFKTAGGLVEATGASFANTWKVQSSCPDKLDWLDDPCSLNIESGEADGVPGGTWGWVEVRWPAPFGARLLLSATCLVYGGP